MKTQAFLLCMLVFTNAFTTDLFEKHKGLLQNNRNIMEVMIQVEAEIKAGHPLDTIQTLLNGLKSGINNEQLAHDDVFINQRNECDSEISFRTSEVADATAALRDATRLLNRANTNKGKANAELGTTSDQLIQYRQHLDLIQQVRRVEQENFSRAAVVFNEASRAVEDSIDLANNLLQGGSFAQLADKSAAMFQHAVSLGKTGAYAAVLASLAKMSLAQTADEADVVRLVGLLKTLLNILSESNTAWVNENNESLQLYNDQKDRLTGDIARLEKSEAALKEQISQLNQVIATQTAAAQSASNKKQRNQKLWDDAEALCGTFQREYNSSTAARRNELTMVSELERLAARRLANQ